MISLKGSNFIAGKESKQGTLTYSSYNPVTQEASRTSFFTATESEIDIALNKADQGFEKMQSFSSKDRAGFLRILADEILNLGDQLIDTCVWETGLSKNRIINERSRTCNQIALFASFIEKGDYVEAVIDSVEKKPDIRRMLVPLGPVLVFPASNFPLAFGVCGGDTVSALAAGCPVIIKAHPSHPQTSELFAHAMVQALINSRFPSEVFSLLHMTNPDFIHSLIKHSCIQAIGFTGSHHVGRMIFNEASSRENPIPVFAEMGSINPVFITEKALIEKGKQIATMLVDSIMLGVGQFCTKPGVIFIPGNGESFISYFSCEILKKEKGILLNRNIAKRYAKGIQDKLKLDMVSIVSASEKNSGKNLVNATLFITDVETFLGKKTLHNEHFGPTAILVTYKTMDDLFHVLSFLEGQLTGTVHLLKNEFSDMKPFIDKLSKKVGRIIINGVPTGVEVGYAMQHGGPYPATTAAYSTSVGVFAIKRFLRPVAFQDMSDEILPRPLQNRNHDGILRLVNQKYTRGDIR